MSRYEKMRYHNWNHPSRQQLYLRYAPYTRWYNDITVITIYIVNLVNSLLLQPFSQFLNCDLCASVQNHMTIRTYR